MLAWHRTCGKPLFQWLVTELIWRHTETEVLMKLSLMAALQVVKMKTFSATSDENFVKMAFSFQCNALLHSVWYSLHWCKHSVVTTRKMRQKCSSGCDMVRTRNFYNSYVADTIRQWLDVYMHNPMIRLVLIYIFGRDHVVSMSNMAYLLIHWFVTQGLSAIVIRCWQQPI